MKIRIVIGTMMAVLYFINNQANTAKENTPSSPSLIVEAIVKYYPNASVEQAEVLMKSESHPGYGYEAENLGIENKTKTDLGRENYIINTERF
jgi:hypothetical protein